LRTTPISIQSLIKSSLFYRNIQNAQKETAKDNSVTYSQPYLIASTCDDSKTKIAIIKTQTASTRYWQFIAIGDRMLLGMQAPAHIQSHLPRSN